MASKREMEKMLRKNSRKHGIKPYLGLLLEILWICLSVFLLARCIEFKASFVLFLFCGFNLVFSLIVFAIPIYKALFPEWYQKSNGHAKKLFSALGPQSNRHNSWTLVEIVAHIPLIWKVLFWAVIVGIIILFSLEPLVDTFSPIGVHDLMMDPEMIDGSFIYATLREPVSNEGKYIMVVGEYSSCCFTFPDGSIELVYPYQPLFDLNHKIAFADNQTRYVMADMTKDLIKDTFHCTKKDSVPVPSLQDEMGEEAMTISRCDYLWIKDSCCIKI